jgi:hypothetical protein
MRIWILIVLVMCVISVPKVLRAEPANPKVLAGVDFAASVFGDVYKLSDAEVIAISEALKGVCAIESQCRNDYIHYTQSGKISQWQGIGQLGCNEVKRGHKTLVRLANLVTKKVIKEGLQKRIEKFAKTINKCSSNKSTFLPDPKDPNDLGDPRFHHEYGTLLLMAIHANTSENKNLLSALLKTFPVKGGDEIFYSITMDGHIVPDPYGTVSQYQVYIAVIQAGQLNPSRLVRGGRVALDNKWSLTLFQNKSNKHILRDWVVKPDESKKRKKGMFVKNSGFPKTKREAIVRIIRNSAAKYHVGMSARDSDHWRMWLARFTNTASLFISTAKASPEKPNGAELKKYIGQEKLFSEMGWAVRSLLIDEGKGIYDKSDRAVTFREILADFRIAHYENKTLKDRLAWQISRARQLRDMSLEQLSFKDPK